MRNKDALTRILIADGNNLFRGKMKQVITENFGFILTSEACSEDDVMNELNQYVFDVLILDMELSDGNGLDVLKRIKIRNPGIPVLIMSMFPVEQYKESVFRAGAHGYVSKVNLSNELITALHQIFQRKKYFGFQDAGHSGEKWYFPAGETKQCQKENLRDAIKEIEK